MSRLRRFKYSLFSGYSLLGATVVYSLASVPVALHYLPRVEFGLWALVMQISQYLQLIDLGMSVSIARILIDHKDRPAEGTYGAVIKTGMLVLAVQGAVIAVAGSALSFWLPALFNLPAVNWHDFRILVAAQCVVLGVLFTGRMPRYLLEAHQRYDAANYSQVGALIANFGVMWWSFARGWGLYSFLAGYLAFQVVGVAWSWVAAAKLGFFPPAGAWGRVNGKTFHELFAYGKEVFLLNVGQQLVSASQIMVITRAMGPDAAAVWSIATKPFQLAQQVVFKLLDFSSSAFAEMMVRQERERLLARFRDLLMVTASLAVWAGLTVALCNQDFLVYWTKGRIAWNNSSNWLMALVVVVYATTRCGIGFIGITKQIFAMKYIYLFEGLAFVASSLLVAPAWGLNGIIMSALLTDVLFSGVYGIWRTKRYFQVDGRLVLGWLFRPILYLVSFGLTLGLLWWAGLAWHPLWRLTLDATAALIVGFGLFWQIGLLPHLRAEARTVLSKFFGRLRPFFSQAEDPKMKV